MQKRNIQQILKAGWYLLELINEVLDLALIESGKLTLSNEPVSLAEVMIECRAMIEPQARQRGIGMTFSRFEIPRFINADRTRVKQVLINLLFNAVKYNRPQGAVAVECSLVAPNSIRLSVRDTGIGLSPEQLAQLFQPFNRLGKEATAEEGTGIGLVVTKRLVELMEGKIGATSTVGEGSVFWVEFELAAPPQSLALEEDHVSASRPLNAEGDTKRTLLYVEDNPANLGFLAIVVVAILGTLAARARATGMAVGMTVCGAAQLAMAGYAFWLSSIEGIVASLVFAGIWFTAAHLFRVAAREPGA